MGRDECRAKLRSGIYRTPAFATTDMLLLHLWLATWAVLRGSDYAFAFGELFRLAELALPPIVWVAMCWTVGGLIFTGLAGRFHALVWAGHYLGLAMNLGLAVGALLVAMEASGPVMVLAAMPVWAWMVGVASIGVVPLAAAAYGACTGRRIGRISRVAVAVAFGSVAVVAFGPWWAMDGGRAVGPIATQALIHGMIAVRMSPRPTVVDGRAASVQALVTAPRKG